MPKYCEIKVLISSIDTSKYKVKWIRKKVHVLGHNNSKTYIIFYLVENETKVSYVSGVLFECVGLKFELHSGHTMRLQSNRLCLNFIRTCKGVRLIWHYGVLSITKYFETILWFEANDLRDVENQYHNTLFDIIYLFW